MKSPDSNRRKYPRADIVVDAEVNCEDEQRIFQVRTKNIGAGGICVALPEMFTAGTELRMMLRLPDAETAVLIKGEVVWTLRQRRFLQRKSEVFETGIKFVELDQQDRDRLIRIAQDYIF